MTIDAEALPGLRVDQVGSLLRPPELIELFKLHDQGQANDEQLRRAQDESIRQLVAKQESRGFPILTDGEHRRRNFQDSFGASVAGFADSTLAVRDRQPAVERLRLVNNQPLDEFRFIHSIATKPIKVTLIGPDRITQRFAWEHSRAIYPTIDDFVADVVAIERRMVSELVAEGCRYVQMDAPGYTAYLDPVTTAPMIERGENPAQNVVRSLQADNAIIEGFPGVTFGIHLCRGGKPGAHRRSGSYETIAEQMFNTLRHHRFLLEYDTERAGGFEPLRFVPKGKIVVLGLLSTKESNLEAENQLKRRIEEASNYLPLEQLALSPACGFGGGPTSGRRMGEEQQWAKLELVQKVAADIWG
jgi:5-methyltetrahydropteroyltriglutamate--homocysteine methyltransferase